MGKVGDIAGILVATVAVGGIIAGLTRASSPGSGCGPTGGDCSSALCLTIDSNNIIIGDAVSLQVQGANAVSPVVFSYITPEGATEPILSTNADASGAATASWRPTLSGSYVVFATSGACESASLALTVTGGGSAQSQITLSVSPASLTLGGTVNLDSTFQASLTGTPGDGWQLWLLPSANSVTGAQAVQGTTGAGTFPSSGQASGGVTAQQVVSFAANFAPPPETIPCPTCTGGYKTYVAYLAALDVESGIYSAAVEVVVFNPTSP